MLYRYCATNGKTKKLATIYTKDEHKISLEKIDCDALRIVKKLRAEGFETYIVGGAVRDLLLEKTPKDFDISTAATPTKIKRIFKNSRIIGRRFRLVHVFFGEKIFEVSTFRSTILGSIGNIFGTLDEDAMRRDFSLNALYYDPLKEQILDFVGGFYDLQKKVLRPVIPLQKIFSEDPVRMIRALKFSTLSSCKIPHSVKRKIKKSAHLLSPISPSRLTEEFFKIVNSGFSFEIVKKAIKFDLYMHLQPAASALIFSNKNFARDYFFSLKNLDDLIKKNPHARMGKKIIFLIRDFIALLSDWKKEAKSTPVKEIFCLTWNETRKFLLPINPSRIELEYAVRKTLSNLGVKIKIPKKILCQV